MQTGASSFERRNDVWIYIVITKNNMCEKYVSMYMYEKYYFTAIGDS